MLIQAISLVFVSRILATAILKASYGRGTHRRFSRSSGGLGSIDPSLVAWNEECKMIKMKDQLSEAT